MVDTAEAPRSSVAELERFLDFAILWTTRENVTDPERVSAIRFHPIAQRRLETLAALRNG